MYITSKEDIYDVIRESVENGIDSAFETAQEAFGIPYGDIHPLHQLRLKKLTDQLTELIFESTEMNLNQ